jgi:very-short-patch-repair endonuclease
MTLPEVLLWNVLRSARLQDLRFRRQHPIGPYILDFYCPSARLAVEVDGAGHTFEGQWKHDKQRERWLATNNIRVIRFLATDILNDERMQSVLASIVQAVAPSTAPRSPSPTLRVEEDQVADPPLRSGGGGPPKAVGGANSGGL